MVRVDHETVVSLATKLGKMRSARTPKSWAAVLYANGQDKNGPGGTQEGHWRLGRSLPQPRDSSPQW